MLLDKKAVKKLAAAAAIEAMAEKLRSQNFPEFRIEKWIECMEEGKEAKAWRLLHRDPICGAKRANRSDVCFAPPAPGRKRCKRHGGLSTGPRTEEGKAKVRELMQVINQRRRERKAKKEDAFRELLDRKSVLNRLRDIRPADDSVPPAVPQSKSSQGKIEIADQ